jgi:CSLREA domain-containing protein
MSLPGFPGYLFKSLKASASPATTFTVNSTGDGPDINPADGVCNDGSGFCTLRAAIQEANAAAGADTINFNLPRNSIITLNTQVGFNGNISIVGPGASLLTIQRSAAAGTPIFQIFSFAPINGNFNDFISGVTISNGDATGTFSSNMSGGGILNSSFCALTLTDVVITGNTSTNGGGLYNDGTATLTNCKITGNSSPNGGGILNGGSLTIINSTVSGNAAPNGGGGGIVNRGGTVSITGSTVSGNTCDAQGGGIVNKDGINGAGSVTLTNSTVSGNSATGVLSNGIGGISNNAGANTLTLINTTVTANTASGSGSGVAGIFNGSGSTANVKNSIVAQNTSALMPHDLNGTFNSQGYNLIGKSAGTDGFTNGVNGDQVGTYATPVDPKLGMLTDNSGPTKTHALLVGSPAIDAGNSALLNDQRGQPRPVDNQIVANAAGGNGSDIGAYEAHTFEVNSNADTDDGLCRALGTGNGCTLREAINAANGEAGSELIVFAPALTSGGPAIITLSTVLPNLLSDMTISGPGASLLTVERSVAGGTPRFRIFTNAGPVVTANISGLTISNGHTADGTAGGSGDNGGAILNVFGSTLNLTNVVISGNLTGDGDASGGLGGYGGAIFNNGNVTLIACSVNGNRTGNGPAAVGGRGGGIFNSGTLTIRDSSISNNLTGTGLGGSGGGSGGGISSDLTLTITGSTISGNSTGAGVDAGGGGIWAANTLTIANSTISGNQANAYGGGLATFFGGTTLTNVTINNNRGGNLGGGGLYRDSGTVTLRNTVVAGNYRGASPSTTADDIFGTMDPFSSFNLIGTGGSGGLTNGINNNQIGVSDPKLATLTNNGGPTQTNALLPGSPAIDAGSNANLPSDTFDLDGDGNTSEPVPFDQRGSGFSRASDGNGDGASTVDIGAYEVQSIIVTNTADSGAGSLRQAITDANVNPGSVVINFQAGLTGTITLLSALPDLSTSMDINGLGATQLTIQRSTAGGTPTFRIFRINSGQVVNISGLTLSNGSAPAGAFPGNSGGAILNSGSLVLDNSVISANTANSGGGISSQGPLTLRNTTVSGNNATLGGGGISTQLQGVSPTITIADSTVSGNSGGGLFNSNLAGTTTLTVSNSTISGNMGGGVYNSVSQGGVIMGTISNVTISGNTSGFGGGIANSSQTSGSTVNLAISNSTISGNNAAGTNGIGGGIANNEFGSTNTLTLHNTIVAGNFRNSGASSSDISSSVDPASSFNLIGDGTGMTGVSNGSNGNIVGTSGVPILPLLGPLANNGGPTQTHALLAGSPALDAGNNSRVTNPPFSGPPFTDQRGAGFARIVDGPDADTTDTVDIGAFEAQVSIADIADQAINEDGSLSLPFNVGGPASITSVTATSSNTTLVPNNPVNISITGSGSSRTLQINPVANASGTSTITLTVNGNNSQTMTDTLLLTVNAVNDAPSFTKGPDQTVNENDGAQTVNNWATNLSAGPTNESGQTLTFIVSNNSNPALFAVGPAISSTGTLTYTPATGVSGTAVITVALKDNGGTANGGLDTSATQTFNITLREGGALQFSSATFVKAEDGGNAVISVTRTGGSAGEARVDYATSNGAATAGQDYTSASGTLIFAEGVTTRTFNVAITNDAVDEPDETINLTLTNAAGSGNLGTPANAVLTINDNDPTPGISIDNTAVNEGNSGTATATFTVSLSGQSSQTVTVLYATANVTATAGSDYVATSGTLTFLPLETIKTIPVAVNSDINFEPDETFVVNLSNPVNATIDVSQGGAQITNDDAQGGFIAFNQSVYTVGESGGFTTITVNRTNDLSGAATVDYFTRDYTDSATLAPCNTVSDFASSRCDYTSAFGTLHFAPGEASKTFIVLISQDSFVETAESLSLTLTNLTGGAAFGNLSTATVTIADDATEPATNPIDSADAFVRQHYHDFLNREPDAAGLAFWSNQITECQQPGATCNAEVRRINVSAAFFLSIEFQETGYLVYRFYKSAYGNINGAPVPLRFVSEFLPDTQQIGKDVVIGEPGADQLLETNKVAYALDFVSRSRFTGAYPTTLTPAEFVDALFVNAGVTPSATDRNAAIDEFGGAGNTAEVAARARALRRVAENSILKQQETNKAFVLMQYFGYLRRNPNDPPEAGLNFDGYNFWLGKLNEFNGNFVNAEMVKAFIVSAEYRQRFGP